MFDCLDFQEASYQIDLSHKFHEKLTFTLVFSFFSGKRLFFRLECNFTQLQMLKYSLTDERNHQEYTVITVIL